eukprot:gene14493-16934_t
MWCLTDRVSTVEMLSTSPSMHRRAVVQPNPSSPAGSPTLADADADADDVVDVADHLLAAFRQSLSSFAIGSVSSSTMTMTTMAAATEAAAPGAGATATGHEAHRLLRASLEESVRASIPTKRSPTALASTTSSGDGTANLPEATITAILERYSDRLVDIVGDKLVHKLAATAAATPKKQQQQT